MIKILTVATQPWDPSGSGGGVEILEDSCRRLGHGLRVLGLGLPWGGMGMKLRLVRERLLEEPDEEVILFLDAYDTVLLSGCDVILEKFRSLNRPLVFSSEPYCWPWEQLAESYPPAKLLRPRPSDARLAMLRPPPPIASPFRYLNAGAYIGYAGATREALEEMGGRDEDDDQGLWTLYFLRHPERVALDYEASLFLSLNGLCGDRLRIEPGDPPSVVHLATGARPCAVHGNGWGRAIFFDILRRLDWLQG